MTDFLMFMFVFGIVALVVMTFEWYGAALRRERQERRQKIIDQIDGISKQQKEFYQEATRLIADMRRDVRDMSEHPALNQGEK